MKSYSEVILLRVADVADVALVDLPLLHALQEVVPHVLRHVALLAEGPLAQLTLVGPLVLVHPSVIQETPGLCELFVAVTVLSLDDLLFAAVFCDEVEPKPVATEDLALALSAWISPFSFDRVGSFEGVVVICNLTVILVRCFTLFIS